MWPMEPLPSYLGGLALGFLPILPGIMAINNLAPSAILPATPVLMVAVIFVGVLGFAHQRDTWWRWVGYGITTSFVLLGLAIVVIGSVIAE